MRKEDKKILKYNHGEKSMKVPFIIYPDLECISKNSCQNDPRKSSANKINELTPSSFSLSMHCSFDKRQKINLIIKNLENMKNLCLYLREHATKIISYEKKEIIPLTNKEIKIYHRQKKIHICKKDLVPMVITKSIIK